MIACETRASFVCLYFPLWVLPIVYRQVLQRDQRKVEATEEE